MNNGRVPFKLSLSNREHLNFTRWDDDLRKHFVGKEDKLIFFHTSRRGFSPVSKAVLFFYFLCGYTFATCYPKRAKRTLSFGSFLWENLDTKISTEETVTETISTIVTADADTNTVISTEKNILEKVFEIVTYPCPEVEIPLYQNNE